MQLTVLDTGFVFDPERLRDVFQGLVCGGLGLGLAAVYRRQHIGIQFRLEFSLGKFRLLGGTLAWLSLQEHAEPPERACRTFIEYGGLRQSSDALDGGTDWSG